MPRKTHGEKSRSTHQRHSSVESEEPLDEDRSLANWLQLRRESLVPKCNTHNLMSQSIPTRYIPPPEQPPGIRSKNFPGGSEFAF